MNVFGSFGFGRLIKTFLPGYVALLGILLAFDAGLAREKYGFEVFSVLSENAVLSSVASVPLAIILGLLSNMVFYVGGTNVLVYSPCRERLKDIESLKEKLYSDAYKSWKNTDVVSNERYVAFQKHSEPEFFFLAAVRLDKLAYLRDSYWYYLEFQLNIMLSSAVLAVGGAWSCWERLPASATTQEFSRLAPWKILMSWFALAFLCVFSARKNYVEYTKKNLSLYVGSLLKDTSSDG